MTLATIPTPSPYAFTRRERTRDRAWIRMFAIEAWIEQNKKCAYCHEPLCCDEVTGDHIVALSLGGQTQRKNIKAACLPCNKTKGHLTEGAFLKVIKSPKPGMSLHIWMAWSRRRIWLRVERACTRIGRMVS